MFRKKSRFEYKATNILEFDVCQWLRGGYNSNTKTSFLGIFAYF